MISVAAYELSKIERKTGTPEAPISDLGQVSYDSYWKDTLLELLVKRDSSISIQEISLATRIFRDDIQKTLVEKLKVVKWHSGDHEYKVDLSEPILKKFMSKVRALLHCINRSITRAVFPVFFQSNVAPCLNFFDAETNRSEIRVCGAV